MLLDLALATLLLSGALAAPAPSDAKTITIPLLRNHRNLEARRYMPKSPAVYAGWARDEALAVRMRYAERLAPEDRERLQRDVNKVDAQRRKRGAEPLSDWHHDLMYSTPVHIGTPPQTFEVHLDTGSPLLWIYDSQCQSFACSSVPLFDRTKSSTFTANTTAGQFSIAYLDNAYARGIYGVDTVAVSDASVPDTSFGLASVVSANMGYDDSEITGLMGFGWPSAKYPCWSYEAAKTLTEHLFSIYIGRDPIHRAVDPFPGQVETGQLLMGGTNSSIFTGDIEYIDLAVPGWWQIALGGITVNGKSIDVSQDTPSGATASGNAAPSGLLDTGTSIIYGPRKAVAELFSNVPGATLLNTSSDATSAEGSNDIYMIPCPSGDNEIKLSFKFGNTDYSISHVDLVSIKSDSAAGMCASSIQGMDSGASMGEGMYNSWLLGDAFLKNVYSVYRYEPPSVGLAKLNPSLDNTAIVQEIYNSPSLTASAYTTDATGGVHPVATVAGATVGTASGSSSGGSNGTGSGTGSGSGSGNSASRTGVAVSAVIGAFLATLL